MLDSTKVFPLLVTSEVCLPAPGPGILVAVLPSPATPLVLLRDIPDFNRGLSVTRAMPLLIRALWMQYFKALSLIPAAVSWIEQDRDGQFYQVIPNSTNKLKQIAWRDLHYQLVGESGSASDFELEFGAAGQSLLKATERHLAPA